MEPSIRLLSGALLSPSSGAICSRDLAHEIEALREEPAWHLDGCCAKTLAVDAELRTVLFAIRSGGRIRAERALRRGWIGVLAGHLELHVGDVWDELPYLIRHTEGACSFFSLYDHTIDLPAGSLIELDAGLAHDVEAVDDSAFILDLPVL